MNKKRMRIFVIAVLASIVLFADTVNASAAVSSKELKKIKEITGLVIDYPSSIIIDDLKKNQHVSVNLSKESDRRTVMSYGLFWGLWEGDNYTSASKLSKDLFGKSTSNIVEYSSGEWGVAYPKYSKYRVSRQSNGLYRVKVNDMFPDVDPDTLETKGYDKIGEVTFILKKKPKSKYGYIIKKMTVKRT